jgi:hypothetical protein
MIPERVEALTSVTTGRSRRFETPLGLFLYRQIPSAAFRVGMARVEVSPDKSYLMATPEKALADKVRSDRGNGIKTAADMRTYLLDSLRVDPEALADLNADEIDLFARRYRSRKVRHLASVVRRMGRQTGGLSNE